MPEVWQHDMYEGGRRGGAAGGAVRQTVAGPRSAKLIITNLEFGVSDQDIKVITLYCFYSEYLAFENTFNTRFLLLGCWSL